MLLVLLIGTWNMGVGVALIEIWSDLERALIDSWQEYVCHRISISFARLSVTYVTGRGPGQRSNYRIK